MAAPLTTLRAKLERRKKGRERQRRKHRKTGKRGHLKLAKVHAAAARFLRRLIEKVKRRPQPGTGAWGGTQSIVKQEVIPVGDRRGIGVTSEKRSETYGNPGSDHYTGNRMAYAVDFATDSNYEFGVAIGKALGIGYSGAADDYRSFYITRAGLRFRVQIICGTHGTGPHTHVGIRRV